MSDKLYRELKGVTEEKLVEPAYHKALKEAFKGYPNTIETKIKGIKTDGVMDITRVDVDGNTAIIRLLMEFKHNNKKLNLTNANDKAIVMCQVVHYIRALYNSGETNHVKVILVGNERYCFTILADFLYDFISDSKYDWTLSPSNAGKDDKLRDALKQHELLKSVYIRRIDAKFKFSDVKTSILKIAESSSNKLDFPINEDVMDSVFDYFSKKVLKHDASGAVPYTAHEQRDMFMTFITSNDKCYMNPRSNKLARIGSFNDVKVNEEAFLGLVNNYSFEFNTEEREKFAEIADQFLGDVERRYEGAFFTPSAWVQEAHSTIEDNLGENWADDYIVWDNSWGTGNLTKGKVFSDLYCSTLDQGELDLGAKCNPEAKCKFIYDFLNDDVDLFKTLGGIDLTSAVKILSTSVLAQRGGAY